jgi:tRNA(fMet)-specific endonuclease VapC
MFVLDTNTLIYFFKGMGRVAEHLLITPPSEIAVPAIVYYELQVGIAKSTAPEKRMQQLDEMMGLVTLLPLHAAVARQAALTRAGLQRAGTPIGPMDNLIAGTALAHDGVLVTHNLAEFSRVKDLRIVDWY